MAFLDPKERVMDIILTQYGRKKLSQGKLEIKFYRFFDDEVDYQTQVSEIDSVGPGPGPGPGPDPEPAALLHLASGTFTRSTSGSYYDGNMHTISWAPPNVLRYEDRGDGHGRLALLEGSRTNQAASSENLVATLGYTAQGYFSSPDNRLVGTLFTGSDINTRIERTITKTAWSVNTSGSISVFVKHSGSGDVPFNLSLTSPDSSQVFSVFTASSNWNRFDATFLSISGAANNTAAIYGSRDGVDREYGVFGLQVETNALFPSSYISTSNGSVTRASDMLMFQTGTFPPNMYGSGSLEVDVYPDFSSDDVINGNTVHAIFGFNTNNLIRFEKNANTCRLRIIDGAITRLNQIVEFDRYQKITIKLFADNTNTSWVTASLAGFSNGNGNIALTPTEWGDVAATSPLYIGNVAGFANAFFGRISNIRGVS